MYEQYLNININLNGTHDFCASLVMKVDYPGEGSPCADCGAFCRQQCGAITNQVKEEISTALNSFIYKQNTEATRAEIEQVISSTLSTLQSKL